MRERTIARQVLKEIRQRLGFLKDVGLDYLTIDRAATYLRCLEETDFCLSAGGDMVCSTSSPLSTSVRREPDASSACAVARPQIMGARVRQASSSSALPYTVVPPGTPTHLAVSAGRLSFTSPGDDLMCGTVARYDVRQSNRPITAANFEGAEPLTAPAAVNPGQTASVTLPAPGRRYLAVRAIDDGTTDPADPDPAHGNRGPIATLDRNARR